MLPVIHVKYREKFYPILQYLSNLQCSRENCSNFCKMDSSEGRNQDGKDKSMSLQASKSETNLFSFHNDNASRSCNSLNVPSASSIQGLTSTPFPHENKNDDDKFRTPNRGLLPFFRSSNSGSGSGRSGKLVRSQSQVSGGTPSSRSLRSNPFDSMSIDRLAFPTCSPSVFSQVVSPSQDESVSQFG